jgi:hypothetical protein
MTTNSLVRLTGLSAIASSILSYLVSVAAVASIIVPILPALVIPALMLVTDGFILLALIGFYAVQYREVGGIGLTGFILGVLGILVAVVLPPVGWLLFLTGLLLFAIASTKVGILPVGAVWLWFGGAVAAFLAGLVGFTLLFALGLSIAACGRAWLGMDLWNTKTESLSASLT